MAKLVSSFRNMAMSLTVITLVAAAALAGIYLLTQARIEQQKRDAELSAQQSVLAGDENGTAIKVAVDGFGGKMIVMVGFAQDGTILGYKILEHQETPGLGDKATWWFQDADKPGQNVIGRQATGQFKVSKDGGDVDAITAATISSRAFVKALNDAYVEFKAQQGEEVEAWAGASVMTGEEAEPDSTQIETCGEAEPNEKSKEMEAQNE
jgi:electron transport complex protein RnfG